MKIEDDTRTFWVFTHGCGCTTSVLTNEGFGRIQAFRQMFGGSGNRVRAANAAIDRGVTAQLVDAPTYHRDIYPLIKAGHTCQT